MILLLRGGRVIDPSQHIDEIMDILLVDGRIAAMGRDIDKPLKSNSAATVIDATSKIVVPGLVDIHVHLREPGFEYKETIASGSEAAAAGGFTSIACMPNSKPVNDNRSVTEYILNRAVQCGLVRVYPIAAVSKGSDGSVLAEYGDLRNAGAVAFSDDGRAVTNSALMLGAVEYAASWGLLVISHCEDTSLSGGTVINEGLASAETGLGGGPSIAEDIMVARDILIAEYTGQAVHIAHVSTAGSVRLIREAKSRGVRVTAETAPHYFTLTDDAVRGFDSNARVNPPLRSPGDVAAIKEGLCDGTIDAIATDHAPHGITDKEVEFEEAASGISGLETALGLSLRLVTDGTLTLSQLIDCMTRKPAEILKLPGGTLRVGAAADLTIIDLDYPWTVDPAKFRSKGRNTPFSGWDLRGKTIMTIVGGEVKWAENS
ncbi:MAG: dihydroorotase [Smithellaceae bacterium]|nr:dihydroorotase [Smithellaceae bacterium]